MLEVQKYLSERTTRGVSKEAALGSLHEKYGVVHRMSPVGDQLVALNYDQISSPKRATIARECRGLVLNVDDWSVAARSFFRFFNAGECPDLEKDFDWSAFTAESKEDGSLILLYKFDGSWRVNTRGSFGLGEVSPGCGMIWEEAFYKAGIDERAMDDLPEGYTYVFELCSPFNKVVRTYQAFTLFLLTALHNRNGSEMNDVVLDRLAEVLCVRRPERFDFRSLKDVECYLEAHADPTFEGLVLRDRKGMRLKVKSARYVALHRLKDNGNVFHPKNLVPLVLAGEAAETLTYLPEVAGKWFDTVEEIYGLAGRAEAVYEMARGLPSQKEFALYVTKHMPRLTGVLFNARKEGKEPKEIIKASPDSLVKVLSA